MTEMFEILPLSPVREWAISRSFIASRLDKSHMRLCQSARQQHGSDRDHIARGFPGTAAAGRAVGVERLDLITDANGLAQVFSAAGDAHAHLVGLVAMCGDLR